MAKDLVGILSIRLPFYIVSKNIVFTIIAICCTTCMLIFFATGFANRFLNKMCSRFATDGHFYVADV